MDKNSTNICCLFKSSLILSGTESIGRLAIDRDGRRCLSSVTYSTKRLHSRNPLWYVIASGSHTPASVSFRVLHHAIIYYMIWMSNCQEVQMSCIISYHIDITSHDLSSIFVFLINKISHTLYNTTQEKKTNTLTERYLTIFFNTQPVYMLYDMQWLLKSSQKGV